MLILASQSPRRAELLKKLNIPFTVRVADIDEAMDPLVLPEDEVARVSYEKAMAVRRQAGDVVIAADTIVVLDGQVLGKPENEADAAHTLSRLSGRPHQVMTGITVVKDDLALTHTEITQVHFRPLSREEIRRYVASGDPMDKSGVPIWYDKAGGYGIQTAFGAIAVERIEGDFYNVMGLPVSRLYRILRDDFGMDI